jgi:hypothetical protein
MEVHLAALVEVPVEEEALAVAALVAVDLLLILDILRTRLNLYRLLPVLLLMVFGDHRLPMLIIKVTDLCLVGEFILLRGSIKVLLLAQKVN